MMFKLNKIDAGELDKWPSISEIPQSPADFTIYDPSLGVPQFEPDIVVEGEEADIFESLPSFEGGASLTWTLNWCEGSLNLSRQYSLMKCFIHIWKDNDKEMLNTSLVPSLLLSISDHNFPLEMRHNV